MYFVFSIFASGYLVEIKFTYNKIWNASQTYKLQLAGQQTLPFVRKTTKDVDNENLGNTNTGSDMQELQSSESTGTNTPTSEKQSDTSLIIFINA